MLSIRAGVLSAVLSTVVGGSAAAGLEASAWAIVPEDSACHTDMELVSRSGAIAPIALISDGDRVSLRFTKQGVPSQAFLPIRVDGKAYANLVERTGDEGLAIMNLSDETLKALRHGKTLQVAWLVDEAVSAALAGAAQGIADLKTCGAQVAGEHRVREAALDTRHAREAAEARAKAVADQQLAAARAQTAAAEAQRQRVVAEAEELSAQAAQQRAMADEAQQRMLADQGRQRAIEAQQRYYYGDRQPYYAERQPPPPEPAPWGYYRPYYPR